MVRSKDRPTARLARLGLRSLFLVALPCFAHNAKRPASAQPPKLPQPVAVWNFDGSDSIDGERIGGVGEEPGPRRPAFDRFSTDNMGVTFDGAGSRIELDDPGDHSPFDFSNGDTFFVEAWVKIDKARENAPMYVIGKGRTGGKGFHPDNQNWSLRLVREQGYTRMSFLFATAPGPGSAHWHRWTSTMGFRAESGWHHVALMYEFGAPQSLRAWIDARESDGFWDLGGETTKPPVVDNDAVWIGSSMGGNPGNTLHGAIDQVRLYRQAVPPAFLRDFAKRRDTPALVIPDVSTPPLAWPKGQITVALSESMASHVHWLHASDSMPQEVDRWTTNAFLLPRIPLRYDDWGIRQDWAAPVLVQVGGDVRFPAGTHRVLLRARGLSRLWVDNRVIATTDAITKQPPNGEEPLTPLRAPPIAGHRPAGYHQQEVIVDLTVPKRPPKVVQTSRVILELVAGGKGLRTEVGEVCVAVQLDGESYFQVLTPEPRLGPSVTMPLTDEFVVPALRAAEVSLSEHDDNNRRQRAASLDAFWEQRHELARSVINEQSTTDADDDRHTIDRFLENKRKQAAASGMVVPASVGLVEDAAFLRRAYLDTVGVPPTSQEIRTFLANQSPNKRQHVIGRLVEDPRFADHWMSFWQDLLAENPTLLNASLNSTGPFRWYLYDSLRDHKPLDRMVTELIMLRGSVHSGGSAGFGVAAENDAPLAAKSHILASAFLGIELQCARCHDSPFHSTTQQDLYALAAMMERKPVDVPETSRVPAAFFAETNRLSLIEVTLDANAPVRGVWPFAAVTGVENNESLDALLLDPSDSRERLAALITSPRNRRFSQVVANQIWSELIGGGIVEPVHDWEEATASHPKLLAWLGDQLVSLKYDQREFQKLIMTSEVYQRQAVGRNHGVVSAERFFAAPDPRRLSAEQIVDSLYEVTGTDMDIGELTFVHDGRREISNRLTLGHPSRSWMLASLNNERDRPSLSLPRARAVTDVLEAFGWTGSRQMPVVRRENEPNPIQPGVLANGILVATVSRASVHSQLAELAVTAKSAEQLTIELFLRVLGRMPTDDERAHFTESLAAGFEERLVAESKQVAPTTLPPLRRVTWFNHLRPEANRIQQEVERRVTEGPPADPRLETAWRETYEDVVWSLINHSEFVWIP